MIVSGRRREGSAVFTPRKRVRGLGILKARSAVGRFCGLKSARRQEQALLILYAIMPPCDRRPFDSRAQPVDHPEPFGRPFRWTDQMPIEFVDQIVNMAVESNMTTPWIPIAACAATAPPMLGGSFALPIRIVRRWRGNRALKSDGDAVAVVFLAFMILNAFSALWLLIAHRPLY